MAWRWEMGKLIKPSDLALVASEERGSPVFPEYCLCSAPVLMGQQTSFILGYFLNLSLPE